VAEPEELEVEGLAGEPLDLPIGGGPPAGYSWELELPPGVERLADSSGDEPPPDVLLGGSRGARVRVRAPAGEHVILGKLVRPWQPDEPARTVRIRLRVR